MGFKSVAVLLSVACLASAGPVDRGTDSICATQCRPGGKLNFVAGQRYVYKYETTTDTALEQTSGEKSTIHLNADVVIDVIDPCRFALKVKDTVLEEEGVGQRRRISAGTEDLKAALLRNPLIFNYEDGRISKLCPASEEPTAVLNIKRGILSMLQNTMERLEHDENSEEMDVTGECDTEYTVSKGWSNQVILKKKVLSECRHHGSQKTAILAVAKNVARSSSIINGTQECQQTIKDMIIQSVECSERHVVRPFTRQGKGAAATITQKLHLKTVEAVQGPISYHAGEDETLLFDRKQDMDFMKEDSKEQARNSLDKFVQTAENQVEDSPAEYSELVRALRKMDGDSLENIYKHSVQRGDRHRQAMLDALQDSVTKESISFTTKLVLKGEVSEESARIWLVKTSMINDVDPTVLRDMMPLLNKGYTEAYLSLSTLARKYCEENEHCERHEDILKLVNHLFNELEGQCRDEKSKASPSILKAIGNLGISHGKEGVILSCAQNKALKMETRIAAVEAYRRFSCAVRRNELLSLFTDVHEDVEVRIGAYVNAIRCPSPEMVAQIKETLLKESEKDQVASFVYTHIKNLAKRSSWNHDLSIITSDKTLEKFELDGKDFSKNYFFEMFFDPIDAGFELDANVIYGKDAKYQLPRRVSLNTTVDIFGHNVNLFEIGFRFEDVERFFDLLQGLSSKKGLSRGRLDSYLRVQGNEVMHHTLDADNQELERLFKAVMSSEGLNIKKSMMILDTEVLIPTGNGLPLSLAVNATSTISLELKSNPQSDYQTIDMRASPRSAVEIAVTMAVIAPKTRAGLRMTATASSGWTVEGRFESKRDTLQATIGVPHVESEIVSIKSKVYLIGSNGDQELQSPNAKELQWNKCSGESMELFVGHKVCLDASLPTSSGADAPFLLLRGPTKMALRMIKTDKSLKKFELELTKIHKEQNMDRAVFRIDTPGSEIDRHFKAELFHDLVKKQFGLELVSPIKKASIVGNYNSDPTEKKMDMTLVVDGTTHFTIKGGIHKSQTGSITKYVPSIEIRRGNNALVLGLDSEATFAGAQKFDGKLTINGLVSNPVELTASYQPAARNMKRVNFAIKSDILDSKLISQFSTGDKNLVFTIQGDYSVLKGNRETFNYHLKLIDDTSDHENKYKAIMSMKNSMHPFLDTEVDYTMQLASGRLQNDVSMKVGAIPSQHSVDLKQALRYGPERSALVVTFRYPNANIEYDAEFSHEYSEKRISGEAAIKQGANKIISGSATLVRDMPFSADVRVQYFDNEYSGKLSLEQMISGHKLIGVAQYGDEHYKGELILNNGIRNFGAHLTLSLPNMAKRELKIGYVFSQNAFTANARTDLTGKIYSAKVDFQRNSNAFKVSGEIAMDTKNYGITGKFDLTEPISGAIDLFQNKVKVGAAQVSIEKDLMKALVKANFKNKDILNTGYQTDGKSLIAFMKAPWNANANIALRLSESIRDSLRFEPKIDLTFEGRKATAQGVIEVSLKGPNKKMNFDVQARLPSGAYDVIFKHEFDENSWNVDWSVKTPNSQKTHSLSTKGSYNVETNVYPNVKIDLKGEFQVDAVIAGRHIVVNPISLEFENQFERDVLLLSSKILRGNEVVLAFTAKGKMYTTGAEIFGELRTPNRSYEIEGRLTGRNLNEGIGATLSGKWEQQQLKVEGELKLNGRNSIMRAEIVTPFSQLPNAKVHLQHAFEDRRTAFDFETALATKFIKSQVIWADRVASLSVLSSFRNHEKYMASARWETEPRVHAAFELDMPGYEGNTATVEVDQRERYFVQGVVKIPALTHNDFAKFTGEFSYVDGNANGVLGVTYQGEDKVRVDMKGINKRDTISINADASHSLSGAMNIYKLSFDSKKTADKSFDTKVWVSKNSDKLVDIHHVISISDLGTWENELEAKSTFSPKWNKLWVHNKHTMDNGKLLARHEAGPSQTEVVASIEFRAQQLGEGKVNGELKAVLEDKYVLAHVSAERDDGLKLRASLESQRGEIFNTQVDSVINQDGLLEVRGKLQLPSMKRDYGIKVKIEKRDEQFFVLETNFERDNAPAKTSSLSLRVPLGGEHMDGHLKVQLPEELNHQHISGSFKTRGGSLEAHLTALLSDNNYSAEGNIEWQDKYSVNGKLHKNEQNIFGFGVATKLNSEVSRTTIDFDSKFNILDTNYEAKMQGEKRFGFGKLEINFQSNRWTKGVSFVGTTTDQEGGRRRVNVQFNAPQIEAILEGSFGGVYTLKAYGNFKERKAEFQASFNPSEKKIQTTIDLEGTKYELEATLQFVNGDMKLAVPQHEIKSSWTVSNRGGNPKAKVEVVINGHQYTADFDSASNGEKHNSVLTLKTPVENFRNFRAQLVTSAVNRFPITMDFQINTDFFGHKWTSGLEIEEGKLKFTLNKDDRQIGEANVLWNYAENEHSVKVEIDFHGEKHGATINFVPWRKLSVEIKGLAKFLVDFHGPMFRTQFHYSDKNSYEHKFEITASVQHGDVKGEVLLDCPWLIHSPVSGIFTTKWTQNDDLSVFGIIKYNGGEHSYKFTGRAENGKIRGDVVFESTSLGKYVGTAEGYYTTTSLNIKVSIDKFFNGSMSMKFEPETGIEVLTNGHTAKGSNWDFRFIAKTSHLEVSVNGNLFPSWKITGAYDTTELGIIRFKLTGVDLPTTTTKTVEFNGVLHYRGKYGVEIKAIASEGYHFKTEFVPYKSAVVDINIPHLRNTRLAFGFDTQQNVFLFDAIYQGRKIVVSMYTYGKEFYLSGAFTGELDIPGFVGHHTATVTYDFIDQHQLKVVVDGKTIIDYLVKTDRGRQIAKLSMPAIESNMQATLERIDGGLSLVSSLSLKGTKDINFSLTQATRRGLNQKVLLSWGNEPGKKIGYEFILRPGRDYMTSLQLDFPIRTLVGKVETTHTEDMTKMYAKFFWDFIRDENKNIEALFAVTHLESAGRAVVEAGISMPSFSKKLLQKITYVMHGKETSVTHELLYSSNPNEKLTTVLSVVGGEQENENKSYEVKLSSKHPASGLDTEAKGFFHDNSENAKLEMSLNIRPAQRVYALRANMDKVRNAIEAVLINNRDTKTYSGSLTQDDEQIALVFGVKDGGQHHTSHARINKRDASIDIQLQEPNLIIEGGFIENKLHLAISHGSRGVRVEDVAFSAQLLHDHSLKTRTSWRPELIQDLRYYLKPARDGSNSILISRLMSDEGLQHLVGTYGKIGTSMKREFNEASVGIQKEVSQIKNELVGWVRTMEQLYENDFLYTKTATKAALWTFRPIVKFARFIEHVATNTLEWMHDFSQTAGIYLCRFIMAVDRLACEYLTPLFRHVRDVSNKLSESTERLGGEVSHFTMRWVDKIDKATENSYMRGALTFGGRYVKDAALEHWNGNSIMDDLCVVVRDSSLKSRQCGVAYSLRPTSVSVNLRLPRVYESMLTQGRIGNAIHRLPGFNTVN